MKRTTKKTKSTTTKTKTKAKSLKKSTLTTTKRKSIKKKDDDIRLNDEYKDDYDYDDECDDCNDYDDGYNDDIYEDDIFDEYMDEEENTKPSKSKNNTTSNENEPKKRGRKSKTDPKYYVNNAELATEIRKYQTTGVISEELGVMLMNIANRFATHPRFFNYTYREDFVSDAICRMITTGINKINLDLPNCNIFAYMTQLCFNSFRQKIKSEKKFTNLKSKLQSEIYHEFERVESLQQTTDENNDNV